MDQYEYVPPSPFIDSSVSTFTIAQGINAINISPKCIVDAQQVAVRAVVRNVGPITMFLAHNASELEGTAGPTDGVYKLAATASEEFFLNKGQKLFAIGNGANGEISVAVSDAGLTSTLYAR